MCLVNIRFDGGQGHSVCLPCVCPSFPGSSTHCSIWGNAFFAVGSFWCDCSAHPSLWDPGVGIRPRVCRDLGQGGDLSCHPSLSVCLFIHLSTSLTDQGRGRGGQTQVLPLKKPSLQGQASSTRHLHPGKTQLSLGQTCGQPRPRVVPSST